MAILEQIKQMREQGIADQEIINKLYEQGISPKQINDALDQSKIKKAVVGQENENYSPSPPSPNQQETYSPKTEDMESQYNPPQEQYSPQQYEQPQGYYPQQEYEGNYSAGGSDMMIEISEQIFSEKIKKIKKQLDIINEFKILGETKLENLSERLKKIETIIDKLQIAILGKIGTYGENLEAIKKEMSMMQDSFGKVVNQAVKHKTESHKKKSKK